MSRFIGAVFIYVAMVVACGAVGLFMIVAPTRFGNLLNESFGLFPEVHRGDWGKKLILRTLGAGLLAFAIRFILRLAQTN